MTYKQNVKAFVSAFKNFIITTPLMLPVFALPMVVATTSSVSEVSVISNLVPEKLEVKIDERAMKIDAYFARHNLPLTGHGAEFIEASDKYNLDYRLIPAIAMRESTGGKFACPNDKHNVFGWASCKVTFNDYEHAFEMMAKNLSGENPKTAGYYKNRTTYQKLRRYNSVIENYPNEILSIMAHIDRMKVATEIAVK